MPDLIHEIARCPHIQFCIQNPTVEHPCRKIVLSQSSSDLNEHQIAEPWSGQIELAPILFVGSNPSISWAEAYPRWSWSDDAIEDYFQHRFSGGQKAWIIDGIRSLQQDGTYSRSVNFWGAIGRRAGELLQRNAVPGIDYAITEVVHCKSIKEIGVRQAQQQCTSMYLQRILTGAVAKVIVVLGVRARESVQTTFQIPTDVSVSEPTTVDDRARLFTFLPHPSARSVRSFAKCLAQDDLEKLRTFLL